MESSEIHLFTPLRIRDILLRNRIIVSPMCQYSSMEGYANDWHLVHLGSRAVGGAAAVLTEATAVAPEGRISPDDLGIWSDGHIEMIARIFRFLEEHGAVPGMQLAHAGRKASTSSPWKGNRPVSEPESGWRPIFAPSAIPLFLRISSTDWAAGGWSVEDSVELARQVKPLGVDLIDCSSGGTLPNAQIPLRPGFQVPFAEQIRHDADILTAAVGMITEADQADQIIRTGKADLVVMAREFLREPNWPLHAARHLKRDFPAPVQYRRAF
jgi:2,4-dienoyl-CoA reductase-like NADH-dependent reductase (Old Yellow Enzyme family)